MSKRISYRWQFIGSLLVVSIITIIGFICLTNSYHQRLNRIEEIQLEDCKQLVNVFNAQTNNSKSFIAYKETLSKTLEDHEARMELLMKSEFEKLQNGFNLVSLWAGIITIVFLVFSIYSIFKTDEMLKKSEIVYEQIKGKSRTIKNITTKIENKYKGELDSLKNSSNNYITEMAQKMSLLNERLANVDTLIRQYKETVQTDETVQTSNEEQDIQDKRETT